MSQSFELVLRHCAKGIGAFPREGNQHYRRRFSRDVRRSGASGVRCALAIALAVRQLGIEVRAGVHTGECELMGDNVGGIAVHTGARIMAKADPGGVLVSGTVKDLVSGSGINFQDHGVHQLKGIPDEWRLFSARA